MFRNKKAEMLSIQLAAEQHAHDLILATYRERLYEAEDLNVALADEISALRAQVYRMIGQA